MNFKARLPNGDYTESFLISPDGSILQRLENGVLQIIKAELIPIENVNIIFCPACGRRQDKLRELVKDNEKLKLKIKEAVKVLNEMIGNGEL